MATVQQHSLLVSKDPPSYYSIYMGEDPPAPLALPAIERRVSYRYSIQRYVKQRCALLQRLLAAIFVATTISTTIMLLLWQLQNLADPQDSDDGPWFEPQT